MYAGAANSCQQGLLASVYSVGHCASAAAHAHCAWHVQGYGHAVMSTCVVECVHVRYRGPIGTGKSSIHSPRSQKGQGLARGETAAHMKCEEAPLEDGSVALRILCADPMHVPHAEQIQHACEDGVLWPWNISEGSGPSVHAIGKPAANNNLACAWPLCAKARLYRSQPSRHEHEHLH